MKTLIVGGGIAGLAIAWRLSRGGATVEIVEREICGRAASWAAAGMIAPGGELADESDALGRFAHLARRAWPDFAAEIIAASGIEIGYRETGSLFLALDEAQAESLRERARRTGRWLSHQQLLNREPSLSPHTCGGLEFRDDAQVDNRALCEALYAALIGNGVRVHERCEVKAIVVRGGSSIAVMTERGAMHADRVVLACGAWMNLIPCPDVAIPAITPVKGQMIACTPPAGERLPGAMIWSDEVYLVPRAGRLLIGATVEDAGFDTSVERQAGQNLLRAATRLIPTLPAWRLTEIWAGLRPRARDEAPVLGQTATSGLFVAGGQFRNGIMFAPMVAELMTALIDGKDGGELARTFSPLRFGR